MVATVACLIAHLHAQACLGEWQLSSHCLIGQLHHRRRATERGDRRQAGIHPSATCAWEGGLLMAFLIMLVSLLLREAPHR